ncbi:MAG: UDP-N-acetylmuramoyl-tripeptide--D-alanyl-D-alanine ligase, partial [Candidatus Uhrbacteria bacterium]
MKRIIQFLLAFQARLVLRKYHPTVVAVTGSVGKTSTRNAIAAVLDGRFRVRSPEENYNNEFGVPLTVIGAKTPGASVIGWLKVHAKAKMLWLFRDASYPNLLALEYGIDRPGDMDTLCKIAAPDVAVFTAVSPVHAEYFNSIEALAYEKAAIVRHLKKGGIAILNGDDPLVMASVAQVPPPHGEEGTGVVVATVTYGFTEGLDVRAENYHVETHDILRCNAEQPFCEIHFDLVVGDERAEVALPNLLGRGQVYAALAAAAVGRHFNMPLSEIVAALRTLQPQAGRMRPLPGIKETLILDDSYNAAPASMASALEVLRFFSPDENARRIAVLGKMAELGRYSENEHRLLGMRAAEVADILVCVNEEGRDTRRGAIEAGMDERNVEFFATSVEAGRWLDFNVK